MLCNKLRAISVNGSFVTTSLFIVPMVPAMPGSVVFCVVVAVGVGGGDPVLDQ